MRGLMRSRISNKRLVDKDTIAYVIHRSCVFTGSDMLSGLISDVDVFSAADKWYFTLMADFEMDIYDDIYGPFDSREDAKEARKIFVKLQNLRY